MSKEEYKRVSLILVISNYEELIYDHESIETIEKISNSGIRLGITASEIMQTTVHQILRKIDYLDGQSSNKEYFERIKKTNY